MRSRRDLHLRPLAVAVVTLLASAALGACERRVEEPIPPAHSGDALRKPVAAPTAPSPPKGAGVQEGRCIQATAPTPTRTLDQGDGPDPRCPVDPTGPFDLGIGKVVFLEAKAPDLKVEIARKDEERARGLMYRKSMPQNRGMIFVFEERRNHTFWMHNTCIPLDMLFIDGDGTIVGIEENTPTMNDSTFQVGCPSTYVLEVNAGWTRRHGVVAGQKVRLEGI